MICRNTSRERQTVPSGSLITRVLLDSARVHAPIDRWQSWFCTRSSRVSEANRHHGPGVSEQGVQQPWGVFLPRRSALCFPPPPLRVRPPERGPVEPLAQLGRYRDEPAAGCWYCCSHPRSARGNNRNSLYIEEKSLFILLSSSIHFVYLTHEQNWSALYFFELLYLVQSTCS